MSKSSKSQLVYLLRILQSAAKALHYAKGYHLSEDFFRANEQMNFNAALLQIVNIGEQVAKLEEHIKTMYLAVEWQKIKGFRNIAVHDYHHLDAARVFDIITVYLPLLITQIEQVVQSGKADNTFSKMELQLSRNSEFYDRVNFDHLM